MPKAPTTPITDCRDSGGQSRARPPAVPVVVRRSYALPRQLAGQAESRGPRTSERQVGEDPPDQGNELEAMAREAGGDDERPETVDNEILRRRRRVETRLGAHWLRGEPGKPLLHVPADPLLAGEVHVEAALIRVGHGAGVVLGH